MIINRKLSDGRSFDCFSIERKVHIGSVRFGSDELMKKLKSEPIRQHQQHHTIPLTMLNSFKFR